jgi:hypothetical protein
MGTILLSLNCQIYVAFPLVSFGNTLLATINLALLDAGILATYDDKKRFGASCVCS